MVVHRRADRGFALFAKHGRPHLQGLGEGGSYGEESDHRKGDKAGEGALADDPEERNTGRSFMLVLHDRYGGVCLELAFGGSQLGNGDYPFHVRAGLRGHRPVRSRLPDHDPRTGRDAARLLFDSERGLSCNLSDQGHRCGEGDSGFRLYHRGRSDRRDTLSSPILELLGADQLEESGRGSVDDERRRRLDLLARPIGVSIRGRDEARASTSARPQRSCPRLRGEHGAGRVALRDAMGSTKGGIYGALPRMRPVSNRRGYEVSADASQATAAGT